MTNASPTTLDPWPRRQQRLATAAAFHDAINTASDSRLGRARRSVKK